MKKSKFVKAFKANWKNILSVVLVGALLIGSVVGVTSLLNKDTKKIPSWAFGVGGINEQGNHVESKTSIYTKDMFECQGLSIEPDFEATGTYKVFYYDQNKNFIDSTDELKAEDGVYNKADTYVFAKYARIMITPGIPTDEDGNEVEDFKIRFYEVSGYVNDYSITVSKDQRINYAKMFEEQTNVAVLLGEGNCTPAEGEYSAASTGVYWYERVDVKDAERVVVKVKDSTLSNVVTVGSTEFTFPTLYAYGSSRDVLKNYEVVDSSNGCTYVAFDVSAYDSVILYSDVNSVDVLEMFVF